MDVRVRIVSRFQAEAAVLAAQVLEGIAILRERDDDVIHLHVVRALEDDHIARLYPGVHHRVAFHGEKVARVRVRQEILAHRDSIGKLLFGRRGKAGADVAQERRAITAQRRE